MTAEDLARMKPTALFVNTSRAGLIAPGVLGRRAEAGRPGMAAVDVYEEEPVLGANHPLLAMDNVVVHAAHRLCRARRHTNRSFQLIFDQVLAFAGGKPINVVNPEALR